MRSLFLFRASPPGYKDPSRPLPRSSNPPNNALYRHSFNYFAVITPTALILVGTLVAAAADGRAFLAHWTSGDYALFFTSRPFLFVFLPLTFISFVLVEQAGQIKPLVLLLICASLIFYSSWGGYSLCILGGSIIFNFSMRQILRSPARMWQGRKRTVLLFTIASDLLILAFFKYTNFLIDNLMLITHVDLVHLTIAAPLGISFFTFQQITLAVDTYRGESAGTFLKYVLFVTFFPHLVAGPLVHHREMMPQFSHLQTRLHFVLAGLGLISIGLFKKLVIADLLSPWVSVIFDQKATHQLSLVDAWSGALAYTFQIYFDFSGYSDMALGLARLFGVRLPINFNSPYKSSNIIDFWRRWHITLSRFLKEYVYFSLGGNKRGALRRYLNVMIVMLMGGFWHGASWNFLLWGGLHGFMLIINHGWRAFDLKNRYALKPFVTLAKQVFTFLCVTIVWVPFRATNLPRTIDIWTAMAGANGAGWLSPTFDLTDFVIWLNLLTLPTPNSTAMLAFELILYFFCLLLPNSIQIMRIRQVIPGQNYSVPPIRIMAWRPNLPWGLFFGFLAGVALLVSRNSTVEFLYWSF